MTFTLPELPYAYDALGPYMSKETLEFHHDKHHKAYVDTGNKLLEGTDLQGKSVEEIVKAAYNTNQPLFNNCLASILFSINIVRIFMIKIEIRRSLNPRAINNNGVSIEVSIAGASRRDKLAG